MRQVILIAGMCKSLAYDATCDYIGIDYGALIAMNLQIPLVAAIGDFDSVTLEEYQKLQEYTTLLKLPTHKNETDSEEAILYAQKQGYEKIVLIGGIGGRVDHELANLQLMIHRHLPFIMKDEHNTIQVLEEGTYKVKKEHRYLSFLALEKSCISEEKVAYPLEKQVLLPQDIYSVSNEFEEEVANVIVHYGRLLYMQCDDSK